MAMTLFMEICGLGVIFLMYVLVQFWKEGHRSMRQSARSQVIEFAAKSKPTVVVVSHPISERAHAGLSVVTGQVRRSSALQKQLHRSATNLVGDMSLKYFPALTARSEMKRN